MNMRCWRFDKTQTAAELDQLSETLWRQVSRNRGDKLLISFDPAAQKFAIQRDGDPDPFTTANKRREVERIMRRHYYEDVLFHGTD
jgi:hypothetical protein